jgi:hypothetical protein
MVFSAALSEAALAAMRALGGEAVPGIEGISGFAAFQLRHHAAFAAGETALGLVTAWVGAGVLRRRPWSRAAMEALTWFGIVLNLVIAPLLVHSYREAPVLARIIVAIGTVGMTAALTVASWFLIRYLRSPRVREALAPPALSGQPGA